MLPIVDGACTINFYCHNLIRQCEMLVCLTLVNICLSRHIEIGVNYDLYGSTAQFTVCLPVSRQFMYSLNRHLIWGVECEGLLL
jgi:hypothetical protein